MGGYYCQIIPEEIEARFLAVESDGGHFQPHQPPQTIGVTTLNQRWKTHCQHVEAPGDFINIALSRMVLNCHPMNIITALNLLEKHTVNNS